MKIISQHALSGKVSNLFPKLYKSESRHDAYFLNMLYSDALQNDIKILTGKNEREIQA